MPDLNSCRCQIPYVFHVHSLTPRPHGSRPLFAFIVGFLFIDTLVIESKAQDVLLKFENTISFVMSQDWMNHVGRDVTALMRKERKENSRRIFEIYSEI